MLGCWEALESFLILSSEKKTVDFESYGQWPFLDCVSLVLSRVSLV